MTYNNYKFKKNPGAAPRRRLAKLAEVLDKLNRTYGVVSTPTKADADKECKK